MKWEDPIDLAPPGPIDIRLIAEPWDAAGAYQLGRSFPVRSCLQWNGRFRDEVRRFVRGDSGMVPALMQRLYGSDDLFPDDRMNAFHAYQSVNYLTSHDGFTLYDLVSFDRQDTDLYVMINASDSDRTFEIQEGRPGQWRLAFDTGLASPDDFCEPADSNCIHSSSYVVHARSIAGMTRLMEPSMARG